MDIQYGMLTRNAVGRPPRDPGQGWPREEFYDIV
jgi:hypothetical protein